MGCPKCSASLDITADSQRTVACKYCETDIYLPDDLWLRLHPVKKAERWYIEYSGESSADRRRRLQQEQGKAEQERERHAQERRRQETLRGRLQLAEEHRARLARRARLVPLQLLIVPVLFVVLHVASRFALFWDLELYWSLICGGGIYLVHALCVLAMALEKRRELAKLDREINGLKADIGE